MAKHSTKRELIAYKRERQAAARERTKANRKRQAAARERYKANRTKRRRKRRASRRPMTEDQFVKYWLELWGHPEDRWEELGGE